MLLSFRPIQNAAAPFVKQADDQHKEEDGHHRKVVPANAVGNGVFEVERPRVQKHHFNIKNDKENGYQVEFYTKSLASGTDGVVAAFVNGKFGFGGVFGPKQPRQSQESGRQTDGNGENDDDWQVLLHGGSYNQKPSLRQGESFLDFSLPDALKWGRILASLTFLLEKQNMKNIVLGLVAVAFLASCGGGIAGDAKKMCDCIKEKGYSNCTEIADKYKNDNEKRKEFNRALNKMTCS